MIRITGLAAACLLAAPLCFAQTAPTDPAPGLTPATGNPNLSVASVRMADGVRASKLVGAGVYSDPNTEVAKVDDLILTQDHKVVFAVLSIGGVMGLGGKLSAVPIDQLQPGADGKLMLPGATKDSLTAMPTFVYNN